MSQYAEPAPPPSPARSQSHGREIVRWLLIVAGLLGAGFVLFAIVAFVVALSVLPHV